MAQFFKPEWMIVYITLAYTIIYAFTLRSMQKQARDSRESFTKLAEIILANAKAAQKSADAANAQIQMMKDKERPRLSIELEPMKFRDEIPLLFLSLVEWKVRIYGQWMYLFYLKYLHLWAILLKTELSRLGLAIPVFPKFFLHR